MNNVMFFFVQFDVDDFVGFSGLVELFNWYLLFVIDVVEVVDVLVQLVSVMYLIGVMCYSVELLVFVIE